MAFFAMPRESDEGDLDFSTSLPALNCIHRDGSPAGHNHSVLIICTRPFVPLPVGDLINTIMPAPPFCRHWFAACDLSIDYLAVQKDPVACSLHIRIAFLLGDRICVV